MLQKNTIQPNSLELLKKLQTDKELKEFHLAGGTSLALQIGHRKSIDLDLFSLICFDANYLMEYLEQNFNFKTDYTAPNTLKGSIDNIKIDFISHKYLLVKPILKNARNLLHVLKSLVYFDDISVQDWPVMILEKKLHLSKVKKNIENKVNEFSRF